MWIRLIGKGLLSLGLWLTCTSQSVEKTSEQKKIGALIEKAKSQLYTQPDSAELVLLNAMEKCNEEGLVAEEGKVWQTLAVLEYLSANSAESLEKIQNALSCYVKVGNKALMANAYAFKGLVHKQSGDMSKAKNAYNMAAGLFKQQGDLLNLSNIYSNIANMFNDAGNYPKAAINYQKSIYYAQESQNQSAWATALNNLASLEYAKSDYTAALKHYLKAYKLIKNEEQHQLKFPLEVNVSKVYNATGQYQKALSQCLKAQDNFKNQANEQYRAVLFDELSRAYQGIGKGDSSIFWNDKAYALFQQLKDTQNLVENRIMHVGINTQNKKYDDAEQSINHLYTKWGKYLARHPINQAKLLGEHAKWYFALFQQNDQRGYLTKATDLLEEAIKTMQAHNRYKELPVLLSLGQKAYAALGDTKKSLQLYDALFSIRDTLFNRESTRKLAQLELSYDFEKRLLTDSLENAKVQAEKDAQLIKEKAKVQQRTTIGYAAGGGAFLLLLLAGNIYRSNLQTKKQRNAIAQRNKQIEWLLKEIHHRVKNNMQIISSLMSIQSRSLKDENSKALIKQSQNRIKSMSLVHESLYQTEDLSAIAIEPFLLNIVLHVQQSLQAENQTIELQATFQNDVLTAEQAVPLGIIVNELISNAYKHAFGNNQKGTLFLQLHKTGQHYQLAIGDDGQPLPDNLEEMTHSGSIGMGLVQSLAEGQLNGSFKRNTSGPNKWIIQFPIVHHKSNEPIG